MKYLLAGCLLLSIVIMSACSGDKKKEEPKTGGTTTPTPAPATDPADPTTDPVYMEGLALVKKSDCLTCHTETRKITGPTYEEVAAKYDNTPDNVSMLAERVIKGVEAGKGIWGTQAMTAHPALSKEDAEKMVKYVFKLKK